MSSHRIVSNVMIMGVGQVATWVLTFAYVALSSRYLGPFRLGELTLAWSIMAVAGLGIQLGMDTLITRAVARAPERASMLASAAIAVRCLLAIPVFLALSIYMQSANLSREVQVTVYVLCAGMVVGSLGNVLVAAFRGREQMALGTVSAIARGAFTLGAGALIVWGHGGVVAFAAIGLVVDIVLLAATVRWARPVMQLTWRVPVRELWNMVRGSLSFWASDIFLTIHLYIDAVILAALAGEQAVGIYAPATRLFGTALFLPTILGPATLPLLSRLGVQEGTDFVRVGRKTIALLITCAVPVTVGLVTFAGPLILTIFGPAYRLSVPVLMTLSICLLPMFVNMQFYQMLAARDQQWRWTMVIAASCGVNPLFNVVLIPFATRTWHNGALGAAMSLVATEFLISLYGALSLRTVLLDRALGRVTFGALAAGAAQGMALWLMVALWPPLAEGIGVAVYLAMAAWLGAVPREDIALLGTLVKGHSARLWRRGQAPAEVATQTTA